MPHRIPRYEDLWQRLESVLMPTLTAFAEENDMMFPMMGPYPRFFMEQKKPGDDRWIDLYLLRESSEGFTIYSDDLPFGLRAGRLKQVREGEAVCAYDTHFSAFERKSLGLLLPNLDNELRNCWQIIEMWTQDDLGRLGKRVSVSQQSVVV